MTRAAHLGFLASFEAAVDESGVLPEAERLRRAEHALKSHMRKLSAKGVAARQRRAS